MAEHTDELYHYGVKGMKWGVHRDRKTGKTLTRQTAAAKRNLKDTANEAADAEEERQAAKKYYRDVQSRFYLSKKNKREDVAYAEKGMHEATAKAEKSRSRLKRANDLYEETEKKLKKHIDDMNKKYGSANVKQIKGSKEYDLGAGWTKEMVKTGITLADIPIIGNKYTGRFVGEAEADRVEKLFDERTSKRARSKYK